MSFFVLMGHKVGAEMGQMGLLITDQSNNDMCLDIGGEDVGMFFGLSEIMCG
jgi:hypothetical protein